MLVPLTRETFNSLIPRVATGPQYLYCWGNFSDLLRRLLISIVAVAIIVLFLGTLFGEEFGFFRFFLGIVAGLYWLWGPVFLASRRNWECRKFPYAGFWRGEVLDVYVSEELVGKKETVNSRGDLVVLEDRQRRLNLEVGDETGFTTVLQVPLQRNHQGILPGDVAEMLVLSSRSDLGRIAQTSDIYIATSKIWVSDYPYLQRDAFIEVSRRLQSEEPPRPHRSRRRDNRASDESVEPSPKRREPRGQTARQPRIPPRQPRWHDE
jgi:hypothetical protein